LSPSCNAYLPFLPNPLFYRFSPWGPRILYSLLRGGGDISSSVLPPCGMMSLKDLKEHHYTKCPALFCLKTERRDVAEQQCGTCLFLRRLAIIESLHYFILLLSPPLSQHTGTDHIFYSTLSQDTQLLNHALPPPPPARLVMNAGGGCRTT
jgi:hypothetical protein